MPRKHSAQAARRWIHTSHIGKAAMMKTNAVAIIRSDTTSSAAKFTAHKIWTLAIELEQELRAVRVDPS